MSADLNDTSRCPKGHRCESCGAADKRVAVKTLTTPLGVLCLTLCPRCAGSQVPPPITVGTVVRLVAQHCEHLGIDCNEMGAAMDGAPS